MPELSPEVTAYVEGLDGLKREICAHLRALITTDFPDLQEKWSWSRPVYYAGSKPACYIVANKNDVNLGFEQGAKLNDPLGLLKGSGASMRHMKFKTAAEIDAASIRAFLAQAVEL